MRKQIQKSAYLAVAVLLCSAAGVFAQITNANVTYTNGSTTATVVTAAGADTNSYTVLSTDYEDYLLDSTNSIYLASPYGAFQQNVSSLNSTADNTMWSPTNLTNSSNNQGGTGPYGPSIPSFTATASNSSTSDPYWGYSGATNPQQVYQLGAALLNMMVSNCAGSAACESNYQDAEWFLFDPNNSTLNSWFTNNTNSVGSIITALLNNQAFDQYGNLISPDSSTYSNILALSPCFNCPGGQNDPACSVGPLPSDSSNCGQQELLAYTGPPTTVVTTPESSEPLLLGADLLGLLGIAFMFRRRLVRVKR